MADSWEAIVGSLINDLDQSLAGRFVKYAPTNCPTRLTLAGQRAKPSGHSDRLRCSSQ